MKRLKVLMLVAILLACCSDAQARWRPFRRSSGSYSASVSFSGGPQAVASAKANRMAERGIRGHLGGGFGGANAEGVGWGSTASAALNACCYTGKRREAARAVVRGSGGMYYAVKLFW